MTKKELIDKFEDLIDDESYWDSDKEENIVSMLKSSKSIVEYILNYVSVEDIIQLKKEHELSKQP